MIERIGVEVAVDAFRADVPVPGVAGERERVAEGVLPAEIERRGAVAGGVGDGVDARIVVGQETVVLQAIAGQRVVGVAQSESEIGFPGSPAEPRKPLADVRGGVEAPPRFVEGVGRQKPVEPGRLAAAPFGLERLPAAAAVGYL